MKQKFIPYTTVIIQFACLGIIALTGPLVAAKPLPILLQLSGGLLGLWAILVMKIGNFKITPTIAENGRLVRSGPYRFIRHPMYSALMLFMLGMAFTHLTIWRGTTWLVLLIDLLIKLNYEEKLLVSHYEGYARYQKQTWRLMPFIY